MKATDRKPIPNTATHPGSLIKDEIEYREISQKELAKMLNVKPSYLNEIIKEKRRINAEIAILLEEALEIPATYWMKHQSQYDIDMERIKEKNIRMTGLIEIWKVIKEYVPTSIFQKRGYFSDILEDNINKIKEIYNFTHIEELISNFNKRKMAFYKKSKKLNINEKNMIAWSAIAEYEAKQREVNIFNIDNIPTLISQLRQVFYENNKTIEKISKLLPQYGIKFIIIEKMDKTPIDGYCFWSDRNPAIAVSLRYNKIDNLAFTLFHEIGHIVRHLQNNKEDKFIDLSEIRENEIEEEANTFAKENLIPNEIWKNVKISSFFYNAKLITDFSEKHKINPAIVFGRLCFETNKYNVKSRIDRRIK